MELENKENSNPLGSKFDQLMDISVDSLDQACLPLAIEVNKNDVAGDTPSSGTRPFTQVGEELLPKEAEEYADNLVRSIIDDTNQSDLAQDVVQSKDSEEAEAESVDRDHRTSVSTVVEMQRGKWEFTTDFYVPQRGGPTDGFSASTGRVRFMMANTGSLISV